MASNKNNFNDFTQPNLNNIYSYDYGHSVDYNYNDFNGLLPDQIDISENWSEVPKYRSMGIVLPAQSPLLSSVDYSISKNVERPSLKKASSTIPYENNENKNVFLVADKMRNINLSDDVKLPERPEYLMNTNFICYLQLSDIKYKITKYLDESNEIEYSYDQSKALWNGFLVRGSTHCKFEIQIYSNSSSSSYIIEANRLKGDSSSFYSIYRDLKSLLDSKAWNQTQSLPNLASLTNSFELSSLDELSSDSEVIKSLKNIVELTKSDISETRLLAGRILCDISSNECFHELLLENGCIDVLIPLLQVDCDCTKRNAMLSLTNLVEDISCQEAIIDAGIVPYLLDLATDGNYLSAETRRAACRILAILSSRFAKRIIQVVGKTLISKWIDSVDEIHDEKLRLHADRVRSSLTHNILTA
uniref:Uncharacterized protein n=1 Tax=Chromulina nebulosa TaxID=96789 RepID=A0A7S0T0K1_9STRA|mmetsp:Transcript_4993/g.4483  ORF Transcript_4993/g.4483 Transcript_4993/m.4483 type:complete len:417 (+) Transcript_4993:93-1343(+)